LVFLFWLTRTTHHHRYANEDEIFQHSLISQEKLIKTPLTMNLVQQTIFIFV